MYESLVFAMCSARLLHSQSDSKTRGRTDRSGSSVSGLRKQTIVAYMTQPPKKNL